MNNNYVKVASIIAIIAVYAIFVYAITPKRKVKPN